MNHQFLQKIISVWIVFLFIGSSAYADENTTWSAQISGKDRISLYKKVHFGLKELRKNQKRVSVSTFKENKLYSGTITKIGKTKFTLKDYKGDKHIVDFDTIKARYLLKIIKNKDQKGSTLHFLGIIFLQEGGKKDAKILFERAIKDGYNKSQDILDRIDNELSELAQENEDKKQKEKEEALALKEQKEKEKAEKEAEKAKSKIPLIASFKSDEMDIKANFFPGKYTIFKFGAPW